MLKILGLDISTTTIGIAVLEIDKEKSNDKKLESKILHLSYYKPLKKVHLYQMLSVAKKYILDIINLYNPNYVFIEDIILFMPRKSTAATVTTLATINRVIGLFIYEEYCEPILLSVSKIRSFLKDKNKKNPDKLEIPLILEKKLNFKFPIELNRKNKIKKETYDMADALAVAYAGAIMILSDEKNIIKQSSLFCLNPKKIKK
jgi:Holliday junction resolvasome RuvABC endonuclease subunit